MFILPLKVIVIVENVYIISVYSYIFFHSLWYSVILFVFSTLFFYLTVYPGYFIVSLIDNIPQNFFKLWQNIHVALVVKKLPANAGDVGSSLGLGRSPRGRAWLPNPVFLPGESNGQWSVTGYNP